ncbi:MAG: Gldg family protein [Spirochaetaceae bacterium]|jgi:hypothetical protein|nr:Gldg family protein [Spirochaetaceae bacterium]
MNWKKILIKTSLAGSLLLLIIFLFFTQVDMSRAGRFSPDKPLLQALKSLENPLYITWNLSEDTPLTSELELFLASLSSKGTVEYHRDYTSAEISSRRRYTPYFLGDGEYYSAVEMEYLGNNYIIPLALDPHLTEERLLAGLGYVLGKPIPHIGLVNGDWSYTIEDDHQLMIQSLSAYGQLSVLPTLSQLPSQLDMLILVGHRDLTVLDIDILDNFLNQGGSLLFLISPFKADPRKEDQLQLELSSLLLRWLEQRGIYVEPDLIIQDSNTLSLSDGSPYAAWFPLDGPVFSSPLTALWMSPVRTDPSLSLRGQWFSGPSAHRGGTLGSLAPKDLQAELSSPEMGPLQMGVMVEQDNGASLAVFGSRWIFSDLILQARAVDNLEGLNGLVLSMTGQQEVLSFRNQWKQADRKRPLGAPFRIFHLLILPLGFLIFGLFVGSKGRGKWKS